ncbi:protein TRIGALACTOSYLDIACYLGLYCEROL 4, chloroplastic-like [Dioscorea cayenensis subsp. rotundata]|uniref:Protein TRIGALACTOSYLDIACYLGLYCEROL 4, chloroplastic-like n=1 Tax=Dioscorea cayennensis subsp. rotundata TaxID=55577 RepID=A0AB40BR69_DIOCR|nr:protein TRIGALACTOSYLDIACYLGLYCEROL 4, chloroplastic-like [Dioscorea cayenensis subsp. rotundata]
MRRMRWAVDGGGLELDAETPVTMEGTARAVPGDPLPLGISRGVRITRPKQFDFMHRFMSLPLVPSYSGDVDNGGQGFLFHHNHNLHLRENWTLSLLEQFHVQKIFSFIKEKASDHLNKASWSKNIMSNIHDMFSFGLGTELWFPSDSSLLVETYNIKKGTRGKVIFNHEVTQSTVGAACPALYVDQDGTYWDVPLSMGVDLASVASPSGINYHLSLQHNSGQPKHLSSQKSQIPLSLLPGLCAKTVISIRRFVDFWRKKEGKLKMVQPYDAFLSDPHVSASGTIGAVVSASLGENSTRFLVKDGLQQHESLNLYFEKQNFALIGDLFATISCTAQHGNFQRLFFDLTRIHARLDFPSGSSFLSGAARVAKQFYHSQRPEPELLCAICPQLTVSLQQQLIGPFSFRADSRIVADTKNVGRVEGSILAIDWALKVLGSARATAWYSLNNQEFMIELRFFES